MGKSKKKRIEALKKLMGITGPLKGKRIERSDGFYRFRRGKFVRIPDEWVNRPVSLCGENKRWRLYKKSRMQVMRVRKLRRSDPTWWGRVPREKEDRRSFAKKRKMGSHPGQRSERHASRSEKRRIREEMES